jgi:feruloyl esterase
MRIPPWRMRIASSMFGARAATGARVAVWWLTAVLCLLGPWAVQARTATDCASLMTLAIPGTTITSTAVVPSDSVAGLPEYCKVEGFVTTPGDAAVPSNTVNFRLGLPTAWNGKFYFQGTGGFAGTIGALDAGLVRGYASASTDTGHQGGARDASWALNNRPKEIDYGHRGVHVSTLAAKAITQAFYGRRPQHAYFQGCSNGGRQALMEAQRYPADYDGIIAGAPALDLRLLIGFNWNEQAVLASADSYVPATKMTALAARVVASCDAADGLVDGIIDDPRRCTFDPAVLLCPAGDAPDCLTAAQVETVRKVYAGPSNSRGEQLFEGFPVGHEDLPTGWQAWIVGAVPPVPGSDGRLAYPESPPAQWSFQEQSLRFMVFDDPAYDWRAFDVDTDPALLGVLEPLFNATDPDLSTFRALGGKVIMWHGWADPALTAFRTIRYFNEVIRATGSARETDSFLRLFLAPGMHHCAGGPGPNTLDALTALEQWVEGGRAPDRIIASHLTAGVVDRTRPLCPYPQVARYTSQGSIDEAANFRCVKLGGDSDGGGGDDGDDGD